MITNYEQTKNEVLNMYQEFLDFTVSYGFPQDDNSMKELARQASNIRKDRFLLMIAGEAKSGKSTFINAYLGKEILPMDVKQCSSAIVRIKYGEIFSLKATHAGGQITEINDERRIREFLQENAALNDEFRDIPIPTINNELLIKFRGNVESRKVEDLIKGVQKENIYGLDSEVYAEKIRNYVNKAKVNWASIVTEILITYPFEEESFRGIEMVDSPGVNAEGRVGDITNDYIQNADAIIFLKPITGSALESTSFKNFLNTTSVERNHNALFLLLTRSANENTENLERLKAEAYKLYNQNIAEHQIICIDSKVELFKRKILSMSTDDIMDYMDDLDDKGQLDDFIAAPWGRCKNDKSKYIQLLSRKSNFNTLDDALVRFGRKSHYLAMEALLERMLKIYNKIYESLEERIELLKVKLKDPTELAVKISEIKGKINEINVKLGETVDQIVTKYTSSEGVIRSRAESEKQDFLSQVDRINGQPNESGQSKYIIKQTENSSEKKFDQLEKITFRKIDVINKYRAQLEVDIVNECNSALVQLTKSQGIRTAALEVDITPEVFKRIYEETKMESTETIHHAGGFCQSSWSESRYSFEKHFSSVKQKMVEKIDEIKNKFITELCGFTVGISKEYISELKTNGDIKKKELDEVSAAYQEAEEIQQQIEMCEEQLNTLTGYIAAVKESQRGLSING